MDQLLQQENYVADLDHELEFMVNDYKDRYPDLVATIDKSIAVSYSQNEEKPVLVNTIINGDL
jgi:hypothetical protein